MILAWPQYNCVVPSLLCVSLVVVVFFFFFFHISPVLLGAFLS